jgi:DNA-binding GntR family transcriptional regulator
MCHIDRGLEAPIYEQIAGCLRSRIEGGTYPPGRAMPSAATLAAEFGVAVMTIRAAVRQLRAERLVRTVARRGTYPIAAEP